MGLQEMPIGTIILWKSWVEDSGPFSEVMMIALLNIPENWEVCDGVHPDVPNIVDKFVMGANGDADLRNTGGSVQHKHTTPDTTTIVNHNHGGTVRLNIESGGGQIKTTSGSTEDFGAPQNHIHTGPYVSVSYAGTHKHTVPDTEYANNKPQSVRRIYIKKVAMG
jgi:hypothetical protein